MNTKRDQETFLKRFEIVDPSSLKDKKFIVLMGKQRQGAMEGMTEDQKMVHSYYLENPRDYQVFFDKFGLDIKMVRVTLDNFQSTIDAILTNPDAKRVVFYNMCWGSEVDGIPGHSVDLYLEKLKVPRVGTSSDFMMLTGNKTIMKDLFKSKGVSTSSYVNIREWTPEVREAVGKLNFPVLLKPAMFYSTIGNFKRSKCANLGEVEEIIASRLKDYNLIIAEEFIEGPEYTVLVVEDKDGQPFALNACKVHFRPTLASADQWGSWENYWYEDDQGPLYKYAPFDNEEDNTAAMELAVQAFKAVKGKSYGRVDIRKQAAVDTLYVLEVNANPSYGLDCPIDLILANDGIELERFVKLILSNQRTD